MRLASEERGQTLVVVALLLTLLFGFTGLAIDAAWYGLNLMRMHRPADHAALAGVVYLPAHPSGATTAALAEAPKDGYPNGTGHVSVVPRPHARNNRVL